ncbi:WD repeat-containing protein 36 [Tachypleus tridentatus]|uniref:WD repeat-containing protein 36 n=1 Tax=Tachypleus tridentatus TaxID=6853 RepID=UPI003FCEFCB0
MKDSSKIFTGYKALGFVSNHVPLVLRYINRRKENLAITVIGKSFNTYSCGKLALLSTSNPHPEEIKCITADAYLVFTGCKNIIYSWQRGTELKHVYHGHEKDVHLLMPFGPHLLSVDEDSVLKVWEIKSETLILELYFNNNTFQITTILHPNAYLNKILLGSEQGSMQLWNIRTCKLIYTFAGWNTAITTLEQAPAIDVVGVGLGNGDIIIHNLKYDEVVMKFNQEWGPVTALSFRTDGQPIMASASSLGHIALWDLEQQQLQSQLREAHQEAVTGMKYFPDEPLLITSSSDNSLKVWIFDLPDGSGRLLRHREGHRAPPTKIQFYGLLAENILSASHDSTLRSFSTIGDNLNKNLGQASFDRKLAKKKGVLHDQRKMPPILDFSAETIREKDWDNIVTCHRNLAMVTTWSYGRCTMGQHKLLHKRFQGQKGVVALCVNMSSCGNFVFIGYNTGHVDKFNIQSGIHRESYGKDKAHDASVRGISTDGLNQIVISGASDRFLKFWKFKGGDLLEEISLEFGVCEMKLHRESAMLAVACDDFTVLVVDIETRRIVRTFCEHFSRITSLAFSSDARWLIVASMDSCIKTWDLPSGTLIDCFLTPTVCTSLTLSQTGEYLATAHADNLGIYLWSNVTLYSHISLWPLPVDYEPQLLDLPSVLIEHDKTQQTSTSDDLHEGLEGNELVEFKSPEQISEDLITLSLLPQSRWQNLLNLDIIKERNKPKDPPKAPKAAPFFLPVIQGLEPKLTNLPEAEAVKSQTFSWKVQPLSQFGLIIQECMKNDNYSPVFMELKKMSPSAIDIEMRSLSPENGGSVELMVGFLRALEEEIKSNKDFELMQSYFGLFLKLHGNVISKNNDMCKILYELSCEQEKAWQRLQLKLNQTLCLATYIKSAVL